MYLRRYAVCINKYLLPTSFILIYKVIRCWFHVCFVPRGTLLLPSCKSVRVCGGGGALSVFGKKITVVLLLPFFFAAVLLLLLLVSSCL